MRGRLPKPPDKRVGHRRKRRLELMRRSEIPFPPPGLLKRNRELWVECWTSDVGSVWDPKMDRKAVVRLFQLYDERDRAYRHLNKHGRFSAGSQGQLILSPSVKYVAMLDGPILALEDRLGLTPRARLQLGLAVIDTQRSLNQEFRGDVDGPDPRYTEDDPRSALDSQLEGK